MLFGGSQLGQSVTHGSQGRLRMPTFSTICGSLACKGKQWVHKLEKEQSEAGVLVNITYEFIYKLRGKREGAHKGNSKSFTGLAVGIRGSVGLVLIRERERQQLFFINTKGRPRASYPETGLESVWFSLLSSPRLSGFRILWLRLKWLLIAWLIQSTCEGQSETTGRGGVPYENPLG